MRTLLPEQEALQIAIQVLRLQQVTDARSVNSSFTRFGQDYQTSLTVHVIENQEPDDLDVERSAVYIVAGGEVPNILCDQSRHTVYQTQHSFAVIQQVFEEIQRNAHYLHAGLVSVFGQGVLLTGAPETGKSRLALQLLTSGHPLIADDMVYVSSYEGVLWGACPPALYGWMHVRRLGFLDLQRGFSKATISCCHEINMHIHLLDNSRSVSAPGTFASFYVSEDMVLSEKKEENISLVEDAVSRSLSSRSISYESPKAVGL